MAPTPPVNTPAERKKALDQALEERAARAELKRAVENGTLTFAALLEQGKYGGQDTEAGRIRLLDALLAIPNVGKIRAAQILDSAHSAGATIDPAARLNRLSRAERVALGVAVDYELRANAAA